MAKRKRKATGGDAEPFTKVPQPWIGALHEAGCNATEILVFLTLAMHPQRNGLLSRPVADYGENHDTVDKMGISSVVRIAAPQVSRATKNLCTVRVVTLPDGTKTPILTQVVKAHRGKVAVYRNNLNELCKPTTTHAQTTARPEKKVSSPANQKDEERLSEQPTKEGQGKVNNVGNSVLTDQTTHLEKKQEDGAKNPPRSSWLR